jgi:hypothetical protein
MKIGEHTNEYGIRVTEHMCETCGEEFTLTPGADDWPDCLSDKCDSYDPDRETDLDALKPPTGLRKIVN